jgi:2-oxoglutarate dehydrogenase complex dehydrogenase (E1) component-like enzyme
VIVQEAYSKSLVKSGVLAEAEAKDISSKVWAYLEEKFEASKTYTPDTNEWLDTNWKGLFSSPCHPDLPAPRC